jgi:hypothetical protein
VTPGRVLRPLLAALLLAAGCGDDAAPATSPIEVLDVAPEHGLDGVSETQGRNCRIDPGDGSAGLVLSTHGDGPWPLFAGEPGDTFTERHRFPRRDHHGCAVADFDGDGSDDVYLSVGACGGTCLEPKELWMGRPDGSFEDRAAAWGVDDPAGRGRVPVVLEVDGDGRPDLFVGNEAGPGSVNRLWRNRGDRFEELTGPWSEDEVGSSCVAAADVDGDGRDELALCSLRRGFFLYGQRDGAYEVVTRALGVQPYGRVNADFGDVDGDGRPDLITVSRNRVEVLRNEGGRFGDPVFTEEVVQGQDAALADVTGDGHADLYVVQGADTPDLLFVGDGSGGLTPGPSVPHVEGSGESVTPLHDWADGRAAFLVNNGYQDARGPRQLVVARDRDG